MAGCDCNVEIQSKEESKVLVALLLINALMFVVEMALGILSESTALIADSMDMLADATVYGIGLYAVGRAASVKISAAQISGILQIILGAAVAVDVVRRTLLGSDPESVLMILVGITALIANLICLKLISRHRDGDVHMRASWIFSKNDVIANVGIIIGGCFVYLFDSRYPDLIIGLAISILVIRGGMHIMRDAAAEKQRSREIVPQQPTQHPVQ